MQMNLLLPFVGSIRPVGEKFESLEEYFSFIQRNVNALKESFFPHKTETVLITWLPRKEFTIPSYFRENDRNCNVIEQYDVDEIKGGLDTIFDRSIYLEQKDLPAYSHATNNMYPWFLYQLIDAYPHLKDIQYDYVVKSRFDNFFRMIKIEKYFNNYINIPFLYYRNWNLFRIGNFGKTKQEAIEKIYELKSQNSYMKNFPNMEKDDLRNDHLFICNRQNFEKMATTDYDTIKTIAEKSWAIENFTKIFFEHIGEINFIDDADILDYQNRKPGHPGNEHIRIFK